MELLLECIKWVNLPWTVLFGLTLLYWIMVIIGGLDPDMLDFDASDFDADVDFDGHIHADGDFHADGHLDADALHMDGHIDGDGHHHGGLAGVLDFITDGDAPIMVPLTAHHHP